MVAAIPRAAAGVAETTWQRVQRTKTVTFGISNEPPYTILNPDGSVTGVDPAALRTVLSTLGITKYVGVLTEWNSMIPGLIAGRYDVIAGGMAIRPDRCKQIDFSNGQYSNQQGLMVRHGNPFNLHNFEDIANNPKVAFGTLQGGTQQELAQDYKIPTDRLLTFPDVQSVLAALETNRIQVASQPTATLISLKAKASDPSAWDVFAITPPPHYKGGGSASDVMAIGFRKNDTDFVAAYNAALAKLLTNPAKWTESVIGTSGFSLPPAGVTTADICSGKY
jgi:polar amino acid transport system substrate-binding protein